MLTIKDFTVHEEPAPHITWAELEGKMEEELFRFFDTWMRGRTCIEEGAYPCDVDRFLRTYRKEVKGK